MRTALTDLVGVRHPIVQTGMGWVAGPAWSPRPHGPGRSASWLPRP